MMRAALALARRSLGRTWPNPAVGCVIVRHGEVVGRGRTGDGGRPHAETRALAEAGSMARGATVYVTLEPCSHHGKTPPCAEALVEAGVGRVISAIEDPDPRVQGRGHARLKDAGIIVEVGLGAREATQINAGFLKRVCEGRPLFHLKIASTLDGRIATATGESKWITGEAARAAGQRLRASHDAILIGAGTATMDDPELTCRLPGLEAYSPVRVVLDSKARLSPSSRLVRGAGRAPVWLFCTPAAGRLERQALAEAGVDVIELPAGPEGYVDSAGVARELGRRGLTRVLVEGGGTVAAGFLKVGLIDGISSFRAGMVIGGDGRSAVGELGAGGLDSAPRFTLLSARTVGSDTLETWQREA